MSFFSKTTLLGGIDNYANTPPTELYAKKTVSTDNANANLLLNSRDRNTGNLSTKRIQSFNNFTLQKGFPILQGQINSLKVNEITMPLPYNITTYNNTMCIYAFANNGNIANNQIVNMTLQPGFYTGTQLATALTALIAGVLPNSGANPPSFKYTGDGRFIIATDISGTGLGGLGLSPFINPPVPGVYPGNVSVIEALFATVSPSAMGLINTLGFNNFIFNTMRIPKNAVDIYAGGTASLAYTEYIDICSDVLTQYQELTDTATDTTNPAHILCRLYIANEVSLPQVDASGNPVLPGTQYTKIHRQFKNAKILRWNGQNSIDRIDLQLFDDLGRPLYVPPLGCDDFQITFSAVEL